MLVSEAVGTLTQFGFSQGIIDRVVEVLTDGEAALTDVVLPPVEESTFSLVHGGVEMGRHTTKAREHARTAITDMITGLQHYREVVRTLDAEVQGVETDLVGTLARLDEAAACMAAPNLATSSQCAPPPAAGDEEDA